MIEFLTLFEPFVWMLAGAFGLWGAQRIARMASDFDPHATGPLIVGFDGCGVDANAHELPVFEIENDFDDEAITVPVEVPNVTRRARGVR